MDHSTTLGPQVLPLGEETVRPEIGWSGLEGVVYHDRLYGDDRLDDAPELAAMLHRVHVFNRAMTWHRDGDATLCYATGDLVLTGTESVSAWHSGARNALDAEGDVTRFVRRSGRRRDAAQVPSFQLHVGQHPTAVVEVLESDAQWQACVAVKGRAGAPLLHTAWQTGPATVTLDVADALARAGHTLQFAQLHLILVVWSDDPDREAAIRFRWHFPARPALVAGLPVIRRAGRDVPLRAALVDRTGELLRAPDVRVRARVDGVPVDLDDRDGIWVGQAQELPPGEHVVEYECDGAAQDVRTAVARVTDGRFYGYDLERDVVLRDARATGTLSGSYQGSFYARAQRGLIQGRDDWDAFVAEGRAGEQLHYWEALTPTELEQRFSYLGECGWRLLHLSQGWGVWGRLDAGGRIGPYGAEQLALYLRTAARHGMAAILALSHYPYGTGLDAEGEPLGTPPEQSYFDAGFRDDHWRNVEPSFTERFHRYVQDVVDLLRDEDALFAYSTSGEGDSEAGPDRVNDTYRFVRSLDDDHLFLTEPILRLESLDQARAYEPVLRGGRTYFIGDDHAPELELGVEFALFRLGRVYLAEGSWPTSLAYVQLHRALGTPRGADDTWAGTRRYRLRLRDTLYLALVNRLPIAMTWDEHSAEDEHIVLARVRDLVDWDQAFREPQLAVRVDAGNAVGDGRARLVRIEEQCARIPLAYRLVEGDAVVADDAPVLDARRNLELPELDGLDVPLRFGDGYGGAYCWSADGATLVAYAYNAGGHEEHPQWLAGTLHRTPRRARLVVRLGDLGHDSLRVRLFDLDARAVVEDCLVGPGDVVEAAESEADYVVLVTR